jgi:hypothetical protein
MPFDAVDAATDGCGAAATVEGSVTAWVMDPIERIASASAMQLTAMAFEIGLLGVDPLRIVDRGATRRCVWAIMSAPTYAQAPR